MKKQYVKPMLVAEHYTLTQSIAACTTKIGFLDSDCVKNDPDATNQMKDLAWSSFFMASTPDRDGCFIYPEGMDGFDSICYHTNVNTAFTS